MRKYLGGIILLVVVAVVAVWQWQQARQPHAVTVVGRVGGEKMGFLQDPEVRQLLRQRYGLTVQAQKYGSVEMVTQPATGQNFLWPASEVNLEYYRGRGGTLVQSHNIFHSPMVFYSWDIVTEALIQRGFVTQRDGIYTVPDLPGLLERIESRTPWADMGLPQLHGVIKIISTDPSRSNSGNSFAGLLATVMNRGEVVSAQDAPSLQALLPRVSAFFSRMGFLEHSSGVLWDKYISQGAGAYPVIVGYENQLVEYSLTHPDILDLLRQKTRILYPQPTVWSSHPFIALDAVGERLLNALQDADIQKLAWERHGFRPGLLGTQNDPKVLQVAGLPETIHAVIRMPHTAVMERLLEVLRAGGHGAQKAYRPR